MKKLISMILIVCMACMMIPAMAEEDLTGEWYVKTMSQGEQTFDAASLGMNMTLTLNADGTLKMESPAEEGPIEGTWTNEGGKVTLTLQDQTNEVTIADGVMTLSDETIGMTMTFTREAPAPVYTPAEKKTDATLEDYAGKWSFAYIGMNGMILDVNTFVSTMASAMASAMGEGAEVPDIVGMLTFEIEGNKLISGKGTEQEKTLEATFADGQMTYKDEASGTEVVICLLQDGMLSIDGFSAGMGGTIYLTPVTAAEEVPAA